MSNEAHNKASNTNIPEELLVGLTLKQDGTIAKVQMPSTGDGYRFHRKKGLKAGARKLVDEMLMEDPDVERIELIDAIMEATGVVRSTAQSWASVFVNNHNAPR